MARSSFQAPDVPENLKLCLMGAEHRGSSADSLVITQLQALDELAVCYRQLLDWYDRVRTAHNGARS